MFFGCNLKLSFMVILLILNLFIVCCVLLMVIFWFLLVEIFFWLYVVWYDWWMDIFWVFLVWMVCGNLLVIFMLCWKSMDVNLKRLRLMWFLENKWLILLLVLLLWKKLELVVLWFWFFFLWVLMDLIDCWSLVSLL